MSDSRGLPDAVVAGPPIPLVAGGAATLPSVPAQIPGNAIPGVSVQPLDIVPLGSRASYWSKPDIMPADVNPQQFRQPAGVGAVPADRVAPNTISDYLVKNLGLTPVQAQGVTQRLMQESSGGDPNAYNPQGGGYGANFLAQWRGPRYERLVQQYGPHPTPAQQLEFMKSEFEGGDPLGPQTLANIKAAKTPQEAYQAFTAGFERPGGPATLRDLANTPVDMSPQQNQMLQAFRDATKAEIDRIDKAAATPPEGHAERMATIAEARENIKNITQQWNEIAQHPPQMKPVDTFGNLGSITVLLAGLAGLKSRAPFTASMGAMGAAMQAVNQNNWDQFKVQQENWKLQTELGLKNIGLLRDAVKDITDDEKMAVDQKNTMLGLLGKEAGLQLAPIEKAMEWTAQTQNAEYQLKRTQMMFDHQVDMLTAKTNMQSELKPDVAAFQKFTEEIRQKEGREPTSAEIAKFMQSTRQTRSPVALAMQDYVTNHPGSTMEDAYRAIRREGAIESAFGGGVMGRNLLSLNTVADHLSLLQEYATALNNKDIPRANAILNRFATETGRPEVTNFETARDIAADEVVRLLTTTGGTEADRQGMQARFSAAGSPEQLLGAIDVAGRFVTGRLNAMEQQYSRGDAGLKKTFEEEMLTPQARKWFTGGQTPAGAYSSADQVKTDYQAGKLSREQAAKILKDHPEWGIH